MPYVPHTDAQFDEMLAEIGVDSFEELIRVIPEKLRLEGGLDLPEGLSELDVARRMSRLAEKNRPAAQAVNFLGGGSYDHFIPAGVGAILSRSEWYTAYTPYQAEVSQGTLQAIYEFQSVVCDITGMEVANASMYDGANAITEAMLLGLRVQKKRPVVLVSEGVHPHYLKVMRTYARTSDIDLRTVPLRGGRTDAEALTGALDEQTAVVLFAQPNFFGVLEDLDALIGAAHDAGALAAVSAYPVALGMITPPGEQGADVVTGEGQCLGNRMGFGGPYLGLFATRQSLIRQMPGRLSGQTVDLEGKRGFVMTLQTREQHIRRGKATSNICTNEGLNALAALVHLALLGRGGFRRVAELCYHKAHYLHDEIARKTRFTPSFDAPFFNEFTLTTPIPARQVVDRLAEKGVLAGVRLDRFFPEMEDRLLVAVTEKRTKEEMDLLVGELAALE